MVVPYFIVIYGPTAVGKTALVERLAEVASIEVINADVGQFYTDLSLGTAKPDLAQQKVPHHLFDVVDDPSHYSVHHYRKQCSTLLDAFYKRGRMPVVVGGSGFYIRSLFFPPNNGEFAKGDEKISDIDESFSWQDLFEIDPVRASKIHPHDAYRIGRAYAAWRQTGKLPSTLKPSFSASGECRFIYLDRDPKDLAQRINDRVVAMFDQGWVEEVKGLSKEWHSFLKIKGLMGYDDICVALESGEFDRERVVEVIQAKTRKYARRQRIFWRGLKKDLAENQVVFDELNLTLLPLDLYIKQLSNDISQKLLHVPVNG